MDSEGMNSEGTTILQETAGIIRVVRNNSLNIYPSRDLPH